MAFSLLGITPLKMPIKSTPQFSSPFLKGCSPIPIPTSVVATPRHHNLGCLQVYAAKKVVGRVVFARNDKTLRVEVTRLAPHPLYKKRLRYKKDYHAHDPLNQFKVGDMVELQKCKPISKLKSFLAVPLPPRTSKKETSKIDSQELSLPLQSAQ